MMTRTMKWASVLALVMLMALLARSASSAATALSAFIVWAGAVVVMMQALRIRKYVWAAAFAGIMIGFNPIVPISAPRLAFLAFYSICLASFVLSLAYLPSTARLSLESVTDTAPRGESL
jgi:hypothetical protein